MTCSDVERKLLPAPQSETHSEEWLTLQHQFLWGIWDNLNLLSAVYTYHQLRYMETESILKTAWYSSFSLCKPQCAVSKLCEVPQK